MFCTSRTWQCLGVLPNGGKNDGINNYLQILFFIHEFAVISAKALAQNNE